LSRSLSFNAVNEAVGQRCAVGLAVVAGVVALAGEDGHELGPVRK
jgi:hypothetical protein